MIEKVLCQSAGNTVIVFDPDSRILSVRFLEIGRMFQGPGMGYMRPMSGRLTLREGEKGYDYFKTLATSLTD